MPTGLLKFIETGKYQRSQGSIAPGRHYPHTQVLRAKKIAQRLSGIADQPCKVAHLVRHGFPRKAQACFRASIQASPYPWRFSGFQLLLNLRGLFSGPWELDLMLPKRACKRFDGANWYAGSLLLIGDLVD